MAVGLLDADGTGLPGVFSMKQCQSVQRAKTQADGVYAQRIDRVIDYLRARQKGWRSACQFARTGKH
jgi:hypothetical protein